MDTSIFSPLPGHAVFETALGFMALAWSDTGLTRLCLPEKTHDAAERRLLRLAGHGTAAGDGTPPLWIAILIADIRRYAEGADIDFSEVPVDLAGVDDFRLDIYTAARNLHYGETTTYGGLAEKAGRKGFSRETGSALGANPIPLVIPCHRILAAGGKIGGFSATGGSNMKEKMLVLEGVRVGPPPTTQASFGF
ncbi:methylated-DNA-[protein]-cysteine S-methyltransferase [Aminobacter aminovorans]|uniref:Methylated-DNA--protein-cysteine methyltransferase, inducible n=1 Tax=Aminobacter aminovorans TaxID=83263 RepID=A0A380WL70_AMIAI|nr:methylated-DNA--[protein]-cysteine S-methyltransferase [Aminobacter aminovorans]TCS29143.1 methylated-DNA-[protein]-cysteine S-methyltransferase [Aminobacter aminovorans]SUU88996.1 Methylated-DNA--protein-cysteine methyltransferase, inducible [Aminobacter aminovorans]